ncbi:MAG: glycosyltransferase family 87 protein [Vicinamibacterales bacterium]
MRGERWLFGLLIVLLVALGWQAATRSVDFPIYHRIASGILAGDYELYPAQVYTGEAMPPHGFRYLPAVAFLFVPFALLPLEMAAGLFYVLKLAAFVYLARTVARLAGFAPERWGPPLLAALVVAGYAAEEMRYGNIHLFTVALMVYAYDRAEQKEVVGPAVALALAIATKITPLALLGYFVLRRRVALAAGTVVALVVLLLAPAAVIGAAANARLLTGFARYAVQKIDDSDNYSLKGVLDRGFGVRSTAANAPPVQVTAEAAAVADASSTALWLAILGLVGVVSLVALWREPHDARARLIDLSIVLVVVLIASPHTQRRYFVQLFVPVLALLGLAGAGSPSWLRAPALAGVIATAAAGTFLPLVFGGRRLALAYESASPYFFGTAVLFVALVAIATRLKWSPAPTRVRETLPATLPGSR